jgi:hypothetical protein
VTNTNTSQVETFRSLEFGALGVVDVEAVRFYRSPLRRQTLTADSRIALLRVEIVPTYAGADGRVYECSSVVCRDAENRATIAVIPAPHSWENSAPFIAANPTRAISPVAA